MSLLFKLPYELVSYVVRHLSLEDVRSLSLSCRRLQYLTQESNIARRLLETKSPASPEARRAHVSRRFPQELRRLLKRREALSSSRPYAAAIVGVAETWLYENGVLLYRYERQLRILDLHNSASTELVVDERKLIHDAIEESRTGAKFKFRLLHYSDGVVSCLYAHVKPSRESWLLVFNPRENRILTVRRLESTYKIFVRNNDRFLYYGTYSEADTDGYWRWVIRGYDLGKNRWIDRALHLEHLVGSDIGSTVCFDIFDGVFYGLANQVECEVEESEWTSYYNGFRFPTDQSGFDNVQWTWKDNMWRRQHAEGPLDDRWTFLRNFRDETTGQPSILESRKEWLAGYSSARRTYYMTDFDFRRPSNADRESEGETDSEREDDEDDDDDDDDEGGGDEEEEEDGDEDEDNDETAETGSVGLGARGQAAAFMPARIPKRDASKVHRGDDGSTSLMFTLAKCFIRAYHPSCHAFLDLVDDPPSDSGDQRIRIRGSSRRLWSPTELAERRRQAAAGGQAAQPSHHTFHTRNNDLYKHEEVLFWPPEQDPENLDPELENLHMILDPPSHLGAVRGAWDDRSMVYSTGGTDGGCKALVFLSFDAGIHLTGIQAYPGRPLVARPAGMWMDPSPELPHVDNAQHATSPSKAKSHEPNGPLPSSSSSSSSSGGGGGGGGATRGQWCTVEQAMYRDICRGYHFGHTRRSSP